MNETERQIPLPSVPLADDVIELRTWRWEDVPLLVEICQDPEISRWTRVPNPYGEADAKEFVLTAEQLSKLGKGLPLAVTDRTTGDLLGSVGLVRTDWDDLRTEIGYWVARPARGRGVATRAVVLLSRWALSELPFNRVDLMPFQGNDASVEVARRAGFKPEGVLRSYRLVKGEYRTMLMHSLLADDLA